MLGTHEIFSLFQSTRYVEVEARFAHAAGWSVVREG